LDSRGESAQLALFCTCGRRPVELKGPGCCRLCYYGRHRSLRFFGGLRETILRRDRLRCRVCGSSARLVVHHRNGDNQKRRLITLCIGCHTRVHRWGALRRCVPQVLLRLWRERHPGQPLQLQLPFDVKHRANPPHRFSGIGKVRRNHPEEISVPESLSMTITWGARIIGGAAVRAPSTGTFK
jgi:hypothetical protein